MRRMLTVSTRTAMLGWMLAVPGYTDAATFSTSAGTLDVTWMVFPETVVQECLGATCMPGDEMFCYASTGACEPCCNGRCGGYAASALTLNRTFPYDCSAEAYGELTVTAFADPATGQPAPPPTGQPVTSFPAGSMLIPGAGAYALSNVGSSCGCVGRTSATITVGAAMATTSMPDGICQDVGSALPAQSITNGQQIPFHAVASHSGGTSCKLSIAQGGIDYTLETSGPLTTPAGRLTSSLQVAKAAGDLTLSWSASCLGTDTDYTIYEGMLGSFTTHLPRSCTTGGSTSATFAPPAFSAYYLVVPRNGAREGSYGTDSLGTERPVSGAACLPQQIAACP